MEKFGDICRSRESNTVYHMKKCHGIYTTLQNGFGSFYLLNFAIIQGKGSFHSPLLLNGIKSDSQCTLPLIKRGELNGAFSLQVISILCIYRIISVWLTDGLTTLEMAVTSLGMMACTLGFILFAVSLTLTIEDAHQNLKNLRNLAKQDLGIDKYKV